MIHNSVQEQLLQQDTTIAGPSSRHNHRRTTLSLVVIILIAAVVVIVGLLLWRASRAAEPRPLKSMLSLLSSSSVAMPLETSRFRITSELKDDHTTANDPTTDMDHPTTTSAAVAAPVDDVAVVVVGQRHLQSSTTTTTYRASYEAQFHLHRDTLCQASTPVIRVFCRKPSATLRILNVSHPTIVCDDATPLEDEFGWIYVQCDNTCGNDDVCKDVYMGVGSSSSSNDDYAAGPFGKIAFDCTSSESILDVEGSVDFDVQSAHVCATSSGRVRHYLRLGVLCPTDDSSSSTTMMTEYVYDDYYFECRSGSFSHFDDHIYTCEIYDTCDGFACSGKPKKFWIQANIGVYQDQCIEQPPLPQQTLIPTPSPQLVPMNSDLFNISVQFEAGWGILLDNNGAAACSSGSANNKSPTVRIVCPNSNITSVQPIFTSSTQCNHVGTGIMECTDSVTENFVNRFTGVRYVCSGPTLPTSTIEFPQQDASCTRSSSTEAASQNATVRHAVQLGVFCSSEERDVWFFADLFFECADIYHEFELLSDTASSRVNATRFTCSKTVSFGPGTSTTQTIPAVSITNDVIWSLSSEDSCFSLTRTNNTAAPIAIPTRSPTTQLPTSAPLSLTPTVRMTSIPTLQSQEAPPPLAPTEVTTIAPAPSITTPKPTSFPSKAPSGLASNNSIAGIQRLGPTAAPRTSSDTGVIIGGAVGGGLAAISVFCLVLLIALRRHRGSDTPPDAGKPDPTGTMPKVAAASPRVNVLTRNQDDSTTENDVGSTVQASVITATSATARTDSHHSQRRSSSGFTVSSSEKQSSAPPPRVKSTDPLPSSRPVPTSPRSLHYKDQTRDVPRILAAAALPHVQRPSQPIHYKDQTRDVPMVAVQPYRSITAEIMSTSSVAASDSDHVSTETGHASRNSMDTGNSQHLSETERAHHVPQKDTTTKRRIPIDPGFDI